MNTIKINGQHISMYEVANAIAYGFRKKFRESGIKSNLCEEFPILTKVTNIEEEFEIVTDLRNIYEVTDYFTILLEKRFEVIYNSLKQAELDSIAKKCRETLYYIQYGTTAYKVLEEYIASIEAEASKIKLDVDMIEAAGF